MKKTLCIQLLSLFAFLALEQQNAIAQQNWASWSHTISAKGYEGHRFRITADMKAEPGDDSAAARIWARVDKEKGYGFFDNMWNRAVRSNEWKTYTIEGTIDPAATELVFGALTSLNGKFYYDNFKTEIETEKNKWTTVYSEDFEKGMHDWTAGIGMHGGENGVNNLYSATMYNDRSRGGNAMLITADNAPNYGSNKKAGNFADVNGIRLYYEIYGSGAPLVVLHGNGGSIESASAFYPELIKKYKVIAIDSRAQGRSTDTDQPLSYDLMASDVNALLNKLNIDSAFMWGQSDGGILCLVMAMDYPKKVKRVVACGANIQPDSSAVFGWAVTAVNRVIKTSKDKHEVKLYTMMRDYPNIPFSKLHTITAPCLIMGGDRDVIRPEHLVKMFQNIPNSQLCILPGSTHGEAWENQEMFLTIMNNFFNKPFSMPTTEDWFKE